jgi:SAM-dependent methyltransferase
MLIELNLREDILEHFPNFEYFNCIEPERLDFNFANNLVGMQQEAFINFWIIKKLKEDSSSLHGLDLGCGQNIHLGCIGVNDYYGDNHPVYGGRYLPHITSLVENIICLNKNTFSFIVASHILEHVNEPIVTFRKWCKLLKKDGIIILVIPDAKYEVHKWDLTHINFYTPDDFERLVINSNKDLLKTECFNDLTNKF